MPNKMNVESVLKYLEENHLGAVDRLKSYLSIPSVSTDPAFNEGIQQAAQFTRDALAECGLKASIEATKGHPCVFAESEADSHLNEDASTVLFYGHYDVQPADPLEKWVSEPFKPEIRNGAIYARGASDDKGQVSCMLEALNAWKKTHGGFPVKVKVLIEGEEECGSENLRDYLEENREKLISDIVIVSDTAMWDRETVAITYGLRGLLYFDLKLHGPSRDLHSGIYGGTLANPATMLTKVVGKLFDDNMHVTIPSFYADVVEPESEELEQWRKIDFDESGFLGEVGARPFGESGYTTLERKWIRPSCDINGLYGGYMGEGAKTVIGTYAGAKVSFRLAYKQDPKRIEKVFREWLASFDVGDLSWEITSYGDADPVMVSYDSPYIDATQKAIEKTTGKQGVLIREGATIPVVADFKRILGIDTLLVGFGLHDDNLHSPNEKFEIDCFMLGCRTHAAMMGELAALSSASK